MWCACEHCSVIHPGKPYPPSALLPRIVEQVARKFYDDEREAEAWIDQGGEG